MFKPASAEFSITAYPKSCNILVPGVPLRRDGASSAAIQEVNHSCSLVQIETLQKLQLLKMTGALSTEAGPIYLSLWIDT